VGIGTEGVELTEMQAGRVKIALFGSIWNTPGIQIRLVFLMGEFTIQ